MAEQREHPVTLVNSVNPYRIAGQTTAAFEVCDDLGRAPDILAIPVGNAGNITAYWAGFSRYLAAGPDRLPAAHVRFQAAGAAPIVLGHPVEKPETIATAIRIGNPASWKQAVAARDESGGLTRRSRTMRSWLPIGSSRRPGSSASPLRPPAWRAFASWRRPGGSRRRNRRVRPDGPRPQGSGDGRTNGRARGRSSKRRRPQRASCAALGGRERLAGAAWRSRILGRDCTGALAASTRSGQRASCTCEGLSDQQGRSDHLRRRPTRQPQLKSRTTSNKSSAA